MDDNFKLPSLDMKHKFVQRKPPPPPSIDTDTAKQPAEIATTESEYNAESPDPPLSTSTAAVPTPESSRPRPPQPQSTYAAPSWSGCPSAANVYSIEMLKGGAIVETVNNLQTQPFWLLGKLPDNHIVMAHPTVSRYHAVLQYRPAAVAADEPESAAAATADAKAAEPGWYLYDLGSTHGSFVNKRRCLSKTYVRLRVGYQLSFGGSTRRLILQGPESEAEAESELSVTEMRQQREQKKAAALAVIVAERERVEEEERRRDAEGASWGMAEDADEESDLSVNPYATTQNEELFLQDPKKTLRGYFEREGHELEYKVDELATGSFVCRIELPLSDSNGRPIVCEVSHKGKKKECVAAGALEACRVLDRHGVLRQSHHESRRRRKADNDDSDGDDDFYDRTGAVERKREEKAAASEEVRALGYDELLQQEQEMLARLATVNGRIEEYQDGERRAKRAADGGDDDLDAFMSKLGGAEVNFDRTEIRKLRVEVKAIETDHRRLQRLIAIARPVDLPALIVGEAQASLKAPAAEAEKKKLALPLFGKRGTFKYGSATAKTAAEKKEPAEKEYKSDEEELDEAKEASASDEPIVKKVKVDGDSDVPNPERERRKLPIEKIDTEELLERPTESAIEEEPTAVAEIAAASKKKRSRPRIRGDRGRDNIDIDEPADLAANSDKYSTWVPPENQSGDGSTSLNDKFGY